MDRFIQYSCIREEDRAVIEYGLRQGISALTDIIIALFMGTWMGIFLQSCVFMIVFIPLRMYAGGYHAKTRAGCACISFLLMMGCFTAIKYWRLPDLYTVMLGGAEGIFLFFQIPVGGTYRLELREKEVYKKRGRKILLAEGVVFAAMYLLNHSAFVRAMAAMLSLVVILVTAGRWKISVGRK